MQIYNPSVDALPDLLGLMIESPPVQRPPLPARRGRSSRHLTPSSHKNADIEKRKKSDPRSPSQSLVDPESPQREKAKKLKLYDTVVQT